MQTSESPSVSQNALDGDLVKIATNGADLGIWQYDLKSGALHWSDAMYRLLGVSRDLDIHITILEEFVFPEDLEWINKEIADSIAKDQRYSIEYRLKHPDTGKVIWMNFTGHVLNDEAGEAAQMIGTGYDITHLKNAELRAEMADKAKSEFLANMSHEIRTPMTELWGCATYS